MAISPTCCTSNILLDTLRSDTFIMNCYITGAALTILSLLSVTSLLGAGISCLIVATACLIYKNTRCSAHTINEIFAKYGQSPKLNAKLAQLYAGKFAVLKQQLESEDPRVLQCLTSESPTDKSWAPGRALFPLLLGLREAELCLLGDIRPEDLSHLKIQFFNFVITHYKQSQVLPELIFDLLNAEEVLQWYTANPGLMLDSFMLHHLDKANTIFETLREQQADLPVEQQAFYNLLIRTQNHGEQYPSVMQRVQCNPATDTFVVLRDDVQP